MESLNVNLTISMFHVLLFFFFFFFIDGHKADYHHSFNADSSNACESVDCGQGTCEPSNTTFLLPFECDCYPGWKKMQVGPLTLPSCVVPNCKLDFSCGGSDPPSTPPPLPPFPSLPNFTDPCSLAWCGDGICETNGTGYFCKCNEGSANLMDLTDLPCFKECSLGADCNGIVFGPQSPPPPQSTLPPPNPSSASPNNGRGEVPNSSITQHSLAILSLVAVAFSWF